MTARPNRSALVTGAARGIGRAIAERLAADGLGVSVADLPGSKDQVDAVVAGLSGSEVALGLAVDVTDADSVEAAVAAHVQHFGGLDVLVANAGIAVTAPLLETTAAQWQLTMDVNLRGVPLLPVGGPPDDCAGPGWSDHRRRLGRGASRGKWQGAYTASKFAVRGLSQSVAQELAPHQITVNVYSPGVVHTPMWEGIDAELTRRRGTELGLGDGRHARRDSLGAAGDSPTMWPASCRSSPRP